MEPNNELVINSLAAVARDGAIRAGRGLSGLLGQEITIHVPDVRFGTKDDACDAVGGPESVVLGSYLYISGDITGHVMLLFPEQRALDCADLMCGQPPGTTREVDELSESAIGELGNVVGSAFINALADHVNLILHPSTPTIIHDMAIAGVETIYAEILAQGGEVVMMDTIFEDRNGSTAGMLVVAPDSESLKRITQAAA